MGDSGSLFSRLQNPFAAGIRGALKGFGDRAARNLYGEHHDSLRGDVWKDLLGGVANSFAGQDVMAPAQARLERARRLAQRARMGSLRDAEQLRIDTLNSPAGSL